jgi:hypothetical protein
MPPSSEISARMKHLCFRTTKDFSTSLSLTVGASVATVLYLHADETPIGVRITLGRISDDQYAGIPDELKLSSENLRFMAVAGRGRCPVQR